MGRAIFVGLCLAAPFVACSPEPITVPLDLSPAPTALVLAFEARGRNSVLALEPVSGRGALALPIVDDFGAEDRVVLTAWTYGQDLAALGVPPGLLRPGPGGRIPSPADGIFTREVRGETVGAWTEVTSLAPDLAAFESPDLPQVDDGCRRFEPAPLDLAEASVSALVPGRDGRAWLATGRSGAEAATSTRALYRVGADSVERLSGSAYTASLRSGRISALYERPNGTLLLGVCGARDGAGHLFRTQGDDFTRTALPKNFACPVAFAAAPSDPRVIFALLEDGTVAEVEPALRIQTEGQPGARAGRETGTLLVVGDRVLVQHPLRGAGGAWRYDFIAPGAFPETVLVPDDGYLRTIRPAATALGVIQPGTSALDSRFDVIEPSGARPVEGLSRVLTQLIHGIVAYQRGFVFVGLFGYLTQHNGTRLCESQAAAVPALASSGTGQIGTDLRVVAIPGGLVLGGVFRSESDGSVRSTFVERLVER